VAIHAGFADQSLVGRDQRAVQLDRERQVARIVKRKIVCGVESLDDFSFL
jgi:hypothetical protein